LVAVVASPLANSLGIARRRPAGGLPRRPGPAPAHTVGVLDIRCHGLPELSRVLIAQIDGVFLALESERDRIGITAEIRSVEVVNVLDLKLLRHLTLSHSDRPAIRGHYAQFRLPVHLRDLSGYCPDGTFDESRTPRMAVRE